VSRQVRVTFLGNDRWSVPSLEALAASAHQVVGVVTAESKPAGRGNRSTPTPIATAARELDLPLHEVETVRTGAGFDALVASSPDVVAVVAYGEILPSEVLAVPTLAPVNLHFSLLPELRGASPVQRALSLGLERTGVTTIVMDEGLDTGPAILQRPSRSADDDAGSSARAWPSQRRGARGFGRCSAAVGPNRAAGPRGRRSPAARAGRRVLD
jgi:methionyl-tRNA formyltransferase